MSRKNTYQAFSLVELSIVLVILGLLVGGVLSGQSLIRASEMRSVVSQHDQFLAAVQTFRDKYFALPGDMTNATQFWGSVTDNPSKCALSASATTTCNGDGDGRILYANTGTTSQENYRFWQQLANAGLIAGSYSGSSTAGGLATKANSPSGKLGGTLWAVDYLGTVSAGGYEFNGNYGNVFYFGTQQ